MRVSIKLPNGNVIIPFDSRNNATNFDIHDQSRFIKLCMTKFDYQPFQSTTFTITRNQYYYRSDDDGNNDYDDCEEDNDGNEYDHERELVHDNYDNDDVNDSDNDSDNNEYDDEYEYDSVPPLPSNQMTVVPSTSNIHYDKNTFRSVSIIASPCIIYGYLMETNYPECQILRYPNSDDRAYFAMPNMFWYDSDGNGFVNVYASSILFPLDFPEIHKLHETYFTKTSFNVNVADTDEQFDFKPIYNLTSFPDSRVIINFDKIYFPICENSERRVCILGLDNFHFITSIRIKACANKPDCIENHEYLDVNDDIKYGFENVIRLLCNPFVNINIRTKVLSRWVMFNTRTYRSLFEYFHDKGTMSRIKRFIDEVILDFDNNEFCKQLRSLFEIQFHYVMSRRADIIRLSNSWSVYQEPNDAILIGPSMFKLYDNIGRFSSNVNSSSDDEFDEYI